MSGSREEQLGCRQGGGGRSNHSILTWFDRASRLGWQSFVYMNDRPCDGVLDTATLGGGGEAMKAVSL